MADTKENYEMNSALVAQSQGEMQAREKNLHSEYSEKKAAGSGSLFSPRKLSGSLNGGLRQRRNSSTIKKRTLSTCFTSRPWMETNSTDNNPISKTSHLQNVINKNGKEQRLFQSGSGSMSAVGVPNASSDTGFGSSSFLESSRVSFLNKETTDIISPPREMISSIKGSGSRIEPPSSFFGTVMRRSADTTISQPSKEECNFPPRIFPVSSESPRQKKFASPDACRAISVFRSRSSNSTPLRTSNIAFGSPNGKCDKNSFLSQRYSFIESNSNSNSGMDGLDSPGGKALMNILRDATTKDAFATLFGEENEHVESGESSKENEPDLFASPAPRKRRTPQGRSPSMSSASVDWSYSTLEWNVIIPTGEKVQSFSRNGITLLDQSLKSRVVIECHPGRCLPGYIKSESCKSIDALSMSYFFLTKAEQRESFLLNLSPTARSAVRWHAANLYWQFPSQHPLPQQVLSESALHYMTHSPKTHIDEPVTRILTTVNKKDFIRTNVKALLQENALCFKFARNMGGVGCLGGLGLHQQSGAKGASYSSHELNKSSTSKRKPSEFMTSMSNMMLQRENQWSECFRGLYMTLLERIKESSEATLFDELPCFYALSVGQTVLFTCARDPSSGSHESISERYPAEKKASNQNGSIVPQIILSSTTRAMREKLREMGIVFYIRNGLVFEEDGPSYHGKDKGQCSDREKDQVDEKEMEALRNSRNSDAIGILSPSFSKKKMRRLNLHAKKEQDLQQKKYRHALVVFGYQDCQALYEYFLNSSGKAFFNTFKESKIRKQKRANLQKGDDWNHHFSDVPLLICRNSLGLSLHMSLSRLACVSKRRKLEEGEQTSRPANTLNSSIELRGPIMPCAARELVASTALMLQADASPCSNPLESDHRQERHSSKLTQTEDIGSHYFVAHFQSHSGEFLLTDPNSKNNLNVVTSSGYSPDFADLTGHASSLRFNGHSGFATVGSIPDDQIDSPSGVQECAMGEVINMIVWDSARPESLAYKVEYASALIEPDKGD